MNQIRALIVDDEPLAREVIVDLLAEDPEIDCIGESRSPDKQRARNGSEN